jgi:hypothetical protein
MCWGKIAIVEGDWIKRIQWIWTVTFRMAKDKGEVGLVLVGLVESAAMQRDF